MIFIDHLAAGVALPSLVEPFQNSPAIAVGVISSLLPDYAGLYGLRNKINFLSHRKDSHNLLYSPFLSVIPVALVWFICRLMGVPLKNTLLELYVLSLISFVIHLAIDILTPFGLEIFFPVSHKKFSLDLFTSLDPGTYGISAVFVFLYFYIDGIPGPLFFKIFAVLYLLYFVFTLIRKYHKSRKYRRYLKNHYPEAIYLKTIPRPFWRWKGIGKTDTSYVVVSDGKGEDECKVYPTELELPDEIRENDHYKKFMAYARFPVTLYERGRFSLINLQYNPQTLRLEFVIDDSGRVVPQKVTSIKLPNRGI